MKETPQRLNPKAEIIKLLLLRSGNQCAFPGCEQPIFNDEDQLVGECCHIEAAMPGGERFNIIQTNEERRAYSNLIFLCKIHHVVTNDVSVYTTDVLKKLKADHEDQFREKPFVIKPNYAQQILDEFRSINSTTKETLNVVKRLEEQHDIFLQAIDSIKTKERAPYMYFGPPPVKGFIGRQNELQELNNTLDTVNTVQVGGVSGIGKTSFLSTFLSDKKHKDCLWIDCGLVKTKEAFLDYLSKFLIQELNDPDLSTALVNSTTDEVLKVSYSVLDKHKVYIVFDAINSETHELYPVLELLNKFLSNSKVIFSTNRDIKSSAWLNPVYHVNLKGLVKDDFIKVIDSYGLEDIDTEQQNVLFLLLNGHPFLIKLFASLFEYQPIESLLEDIRNESPVEISNYIKNKILSNLLDDEIKFIEFVSVLGIPFRFDLLRFLPFSNSQNILKNLQKKYLIERRQQNLFEVPEFILSFLVDVNLKVQIQVHKLSVDYLQSIKSDSFIFERWAVIYHALKSGLSEVAKSETYSFLSTMMGIGNFNLAFRLANDLEHDERSKYWDMIYYVQGRILRFQEHYDQALSKYEKGLSDCVNGELVEKIKFEKASVLMYIYRASDQQEYREEAMTIYNELCESNNLDTYIQSKATLASLIIHESRLDVKISKLDCILEEAIQKNASSNVIISLWMLLGKAYTENNEYQEALNCFNKCFAHYDNAMETYGMNTIDNLHSLYTSLAWTYSKLENHAEAAKVSGIAAELAKSYGLFHKYEKSLFDYGYHLIIIGEYSSAAEILTEHYHHIKTQNLFEELDMIYTYLALAFSHWYSGLYEDAVQLMGLFIIENAKYGKQAPVVLIHSNDLKEERFPFEWFKKGALTLVLPQDKTYEDFNSWVKRRL
ncbi:hypothetical protein ACSX1A_11000 [Pontibacter sp. MBLB2868]|uniref:hypothetical protein n=1 Tax=Pontibacter sp. MBLB2868 TaxID=3451555 RepID=UPI003F750CD2